MAQGRPELVRGVWNWGGKLVGSGRVDKPACEING